MNDKVKADDSAEKNDEIAAPVERLVICDEVDIKRLTIEWGTQENPTGYEEAYAMIRNKYGDGGTRTVRLGPKVVDFPRVSDTVSQWIVDVYI